LKRASSAIAQAALHRVLAGAHRVICNGSTFTRRSTPT
jgi:hypothetical protein